MANDLVCRVWGWPEGSTLTLSPLPWQVQKPETCAQPVPRCSPHPCGLPKSRDHVLPATIPPLTHRMHPAPGPWLAKLGCEGALCSGRQRWSIS